jgi:hypothetical protein
MKPVFEKRTPTRHGSPVLGLVNTVVPPQMDVFLRRFFLTIEQIVKDREGTILGGPSGNLAGRRIPRQIRRIVPARVVILLLTPGAAMGFLIFR